MSNQQISEDRRMALAAMHNLGWTSTRLSKNAWLFTRPNTDGLRDAVKRYDQDLSMLSVVDIAMTYGDAPELHDRIEQMKLEWAQERFYGLYSMATAPEDKTDG